MFPGLVIFIGSLAAAARSAAAVLF
jgi:hypothetical protein